MLELASEFEELNDEQKDAVLHPGNIVVLAGPGSGKTSTLVIKVAHLLNSSISPPQGIAVITYNRDTVEEFKARLLQFGIHPNRRIYLGTVHGFCFNCVLRPFASIGKGPYKPKVVSESQSETLLQSALDTFGINERPKWFRSTLTRIRRRLACDEDVSGFMASELKVAKKYEELLQVSGEIDFEGMVLEALKLIRADSQIASLLVAKFPWLVVDEYQDLGGPLHKIVVSLVDSAGASVFAVGDPDQTIYDFTGADPKYLEELGSRQDFKSIQLKFNYRSGSELIAASEAALALKTPRNYRPNPKRRDPGKVYFNEINGDTEDQADFTCNTIIPKLIDQKVPLHEIAVLYRQQGHILDKIQERLASSGIPFAIEKNEQWPRTRIIQWLQKCAAYALADKPEEGLFMSDLSREFAHLLRESGSEDEAHVMLQARIKLYPIVNERVDGSLSLGSWLKNVDQSLKLSKLLESARPTESDRESFQELLNTTSDGGQLKGVTLSEFAVNGRMSGQIVVTTLHSSKGREFDAIVMPAVQEGIMPRRPWDALRRKNVEPNPVALAEDRRLFYVGLTRARRFVFLLFSKSYTNNYGYKVSLGPSRFISEIRKRIES